MKRAILILLMLGAGLCVLPEIAHAQLGTNGQAIGQGFKPLGDVVLYKNGRFARAFPCTNTNTSRGAAWTTALAYATANASSTTAWFMDVGPGTFEITSTDSLDTPASGYFAMRGAGRYATTLYFNINADEGLQCRGNTVVKDMEIRCSATTLESYLVRNALENLCENVWFTTEDQAARKIYLDGSSGSPATVEFRNCKIDTGISNAGAVIAVNGCDGTVQTDCQVYWDFDSSHATQQATFRNCSFVSTNSNVANMFKLGPNTSSLTIIGGRYEIASGSASICAITNSLNTRTVNVSNAEFVLSASANGFSMAGAASDTSSINLKNSSISGGTSQLAQSGDGTINVANVNYDTAKKSGTITPLNTNAMLAGLGVSAIGTVTSVTPNLPTAVFTNGSAVTTSGNLTATFANQSANTFFAGPTSGSAATPTMRSQVTADVPARLSFTVYAPTNTVATGTNLMYYIVPPSLAGRSISFVHQYNVTPGTGTGVTSIQVHRIRSGSSVDVLSTVNSVDPTENGSDTGTPGTINATNALLAAYDVITIDCTAITGTNAAIGQIVTLEIQ